MNNLLRRARARPVRRRVTRSMFSPGCSTMRLAARKAQGMVTLSRYRSAISRTKDCPGSSWMKPSYGIVPVAATAMAAAPLHRAGGMVKRLIRFVRSLRASAVIFPPPPVHPNLKGQQSVAFLHPSAFNSAQHVQGAVRQHLTKSPCIHAAGDRHPLAIFGPKPCLAPRQPGPVWDQRRRCVEPHAIFTDCRKGGTRMCEKPQRVMTDRGSGDKQDHRDALKRNGVIARRQRVGRRCFSLQESENRSSDPSYARRRTIFRISRKGVGHA